MELPGDVGCAEVSRPQFSELEKIQVKLGQYIVKIREFLNSACSTVEGAQSCHLVRSLAIVVYLFVTSIKFPYIPRFSFRTFCIFLALNTFAELFF